MWIVYKLKINCGLHIFRSVAIYNIIKVHVPWSLSLNPPCTKTLNTVEVTSLLQFTKAHCKQITSSSSTITTAPSNRNTHISTCQTLFCDIASSYTKKVEFISSFISPITCISKMNFEFCFSSAFMPNNDSRKKSMRFNSISLLIIWFDFIKTDVAIEPFFFEAT